MKKTIKILFMSFLMTVLFVVPVFAQKSTTHSGNNVEAQNYPRNYATVIESYLTRCEDGTLMRVQYVASEEQVIAEYYDDTYELLDTKVISQELPLFGGFYAMDNNYYLVTGQTNPNESADVEIYRITKYDTDWKRIDSVGLYDCNTTIPFDAGSLRMDSDGKYLLIRTCHEMYTSNDGYNHQANVTIQVDTEAMEITDSFTEIMNSSYGYVSHSFNQFIKIDDGKIVAMDHGDAHPRSLVLCLYPTQVANESFVSRNVECIDVLTFKGFMGDNKTSATVGGFEVSEDAYLVTGTSIVQDENYSSRSTQNVFLAAVDKNTKKVTFHWLTTYEEGEMKANTPQLVKITDDRFMILWSRDDVVYYTECDGTGTQTSTVYSIKNANLSDCVPVVKDDTVIWYVWNNGKITFYEINLDRIEKPQAIVLEDGLKLVEKFCGDGKHTIEHLEAKESTCTEDGWIEHWGCVNCGAGFEDKAGTTELYEEEYLFPAGHKYDAESITNGVGHFICSGCGFETDKSVYTSLTLYWNTDGGSSYSTGISSALKVGDTLYSYISYGDAGLDDEIIVEISDRNIMKYVKTLSYSSGMQLGYFEVLKAGEISVTVRSKWNPNLFRTKTFYVSCAEHVWSKDYISDGASHWYGCSRCEEKKDEAKHYGGEATEIEKAICEACGTAYGTILNRHPFIDVFEYDWYDAAVQYVFNNGIMTGMTSNIFGPIESLSRAQFAVMLYRLEGQPDVIYTAKFPDVPEGTWYTNAIMWASEHGIITGYADGMFGAVDNITREQMATIMYRYAKAKGYDVNEIASIDSFADGATVSSFAAEAMQWTAGTGIITGKDNGTRLAPQENAARAECAVIFMRFMEKYK